MPPPLWQWSIRRLDHRVVFVTREVEANEPFLEQSPRHLLQQRNPSPVHDDEVIIGSEYGRYAELRGKRRNTEP